MALGLVTKGLVADKYLKKAKQIQFQLNKAKDVLQSNPQLNQEVTEMPQDIGQLAQMFMQNPEQLKELGIDPKIIENPVVRGFIDKYISKVAGQKTQQSEQNTYSPDLFKDD